MSEFLYRLQPTRPARLTERLTPDESAALEAQQIMDDPAVRARVMRAELFPFRIAGGSPGLSGRA